MRWISYKRVEFHGEPEPVVNDLLAFVYDVPYLGVCGIFPPYHILNEILSSGGSDGGMSPGAVWSPFQISEEEYAELIEAMAASVPEDLREKARYSDVRFETDPEFDDIRDRSRWVAAVCGKHRTNRHV